MQENSTENSANTESRIWGKVLSGVLVVFILGAVAALYYSVTTPFKEPFTEFYLLNTEGMARDYPREINVGEEVAVLVGVVNHEYRTMSYKLAVRTIGSVSVKTAEVVLEHEDKWEETTGFVLNEVGVNQTVEFLLYDNESGEIYNTLSLIVTVK